MEYSQVDSREIVISTDMQLLLIGMLCLDFYKERSTLLSELRYELPNLSYKKNANLISKVGYFTDAPASYTSGGYIESMFINDIEWIITQSDNQEIMFTNDANSYLSIDGTSGELLITKVVNGTSEYSTTIPFPYQTPDKNSWLSTQIEFLLAMAETNKELSGLLQLHTGALNPHQYTNEVVAKLSYIQSSINKLESHVTDNELIHTPSSRILTGNNFSPIQLPEIKVTGGKVKLGEVEL